MDAAIALPFQRLMTAREPEVLLRARRRRAPARTSTTALIARDTTLSAACEELAQSIEARRVPDLLAECLHHAAALGWLNAATPASPV